MRLPGVKYEGAQEGRTHCAAFQNCSRQFPRSRARCSDVGICSQKLLVAARRSTTEYEKISESRTNAHRDTAQSARHTEFNPVSCYIGERATISDHSIRHMLEWSGTPHQILQPAISSLLIHFSTLQFSATHLVQRFSLEGSLVHALDYHH